jgi:hypothetical protein
MLDYQQQFANPELQALTYGLEQQYRPKYAALNLADIGQYQQGGINLLGQGTQQLGEIEQQALAQQRAGDVAAIGQYGSGVTQAMRQADPYAAAIADQQQQMAMQLYGQSQGLTPEQRRLAEQQARAGGMARGRIGDQSSVAAEILGREGFLSSKRQEAMGAGQLAQSYNQQFSSPLMSILGRPSSAMQYAQGQQGLAYQQAQGPVGPRFSDPNAGVNLALQNASNLSNYNASIYGAQAGLAGAKAQANAAMVAGIAQGAGNIAGAAYLKCWVAREVYGVSNPKWLQFRAWLETSAPKWFHDLYVKHGEKFALFISNKPALKYLIRKWMDGRIANAQAIYA